MFKYNKNNLLNFKDVNILNTQLVIYFLNFNFTNIVIIIQKKIEQDI